MKSNPDPAFPIQPFRQPNGDFDWGRDGLSARAYFASRAPHEPASWFEPNMPPRPESKWMDLAGNVYPTAGAAETSAGYRAFHDANREAIEAWERQRRIAFTAQWPWAWADAVLAAENGGGV